MTISENNHASAAQNQSGYEIADRQIEATIAVAYEQRTANLIAFRAMTGAIIASGSHPSYEMLLQMDRADKQIIERLGLEG